MTFNDKQIEILLVAETLFANEGFDGTSVRDIAKKAAINVAMISYYFGSKDKLLEALILYRIGSLKLHLEEISNANILVTQKIDDFISLYINRIHTNRKIYQIVQAEINNSNRNFNMDLFIDVKKENLAIIEAIIREGQEQNIFQKNVIIGLIPTTVIGTLMHFYTNKKYYQELFDLKTDACFENYISTTLTHQIQTTIKGLLTYEIKN